MGIVEIDPALADTAALTEAYGLSLTDGANCVVVAGRRAGEERVAACVVRADTRADVNNVVRRTLDVRKASFLAMDRAVAESGMEYGGITPDRPARRGGGCWSTSGVTGIDVAVIGSGVRHSKMLLPGALLGDAARRRGRRRASPADGVHRPAGTEGSPGRHPESGRRTGRARTVVVPRHHRKGSHVRHGTRPGPLRHRPARLPARRQPDRLASSGDGRPLDDPLFHRGGQPRARGVCGKVGLHRSRGGTPVA